MSKKIRQGAMASRLPVLMLVLGAIMLNACGGIGTPVPTQPPQTTSPPPTGPTQSPAGTTVSLGSHSIAVGATIPIAVNMTGSDQVAGGFVKIEFNNSVVAIENVSPGDLGSPTTVIDNQNGFVSIAVAQASAIGRSQATLAVINVRGVSAGETDLQISEVELNDAAGNLMTPGIEDGLVSVQ